MDEQAERAGRVSPPVDPIPPPEPSTTTGESSAGEQGRAVAQSAQERGKDVAGTAREQAARVSDEAMHQGRRVVDETTRQVRAQASEQTGRAAGALQRLGEQVGALADGRTEEAGEVDQYVRQVSDWLSRTGGRVEELGFDGLMNELRGFARRRPGSFLAGLAAAGFVAGRVARNAGGDAGAGGSGGQPGQAAPLPPRAQATSATEPSDPLSRPRQAEPLAPPEAYGEGRDPLVEPDAVGQPGTVPPGQMPPQRPPGVR